MNKIGIIDHVGRKAGIDYYSTELARGFVKFGFEVTICSNYEAEHEGIKFYSYFPFFIKSKPLQFLYLLKAYTLSALKCRANKSRLVIVHLFTSQILHTFFLMLMRLFGLQLIVISHDVESFAKDDSDWIKKFIYNKLAKHIIVHNEYSLNAIKKYCSIHSKIHVIQQGGYLNLAENKLTKNAAREKLKSINSSDIVILFFGQIKKVKRLDLLLKAAPLISKNVKIVIAGKVWKDDFSSYQQIIEEENIENKLLLNIRYITDEEREIFMKASDIMVLPYEEIFQSAVLLMGMSYSKAMITSDVSAFREVVDGENGLMFESGNHQSLAEKINYLVEDINRIEKFGSRGVETIKQKFSWDRIASEYIQKLKLQ